MHPETQISKGIDTTACLAEQHGASLSHSLSLIDEWIEETLRMIDVSPSDGQSGCRLFYKDGLFDDLMLRLYRRPENDHGVMALVLARIWIGERYRGDGIFTAFRVYLQQKAQVIGARFIVESANPVLGGILRSSREYYRLEPNSTPIGLIMDDSYNSWVHSPQGAMKEICLPMSPELYRQLHRNLVDFEKEQIDELRTRVSRFISEIWARPVCSDG